MTITPGKIFLVCWIVYAIALSWALYRPAPWPRNASLLSRRLKHPLALLVVGATGGTGRELVRQALTRGHTVTAFVRNPKRLQIEHENLRIARGDVMDYASVEAAMRGQDAVPRLFPRWTVRSITSRNLRAIRSSPFRVLNRHFRCAPRHSCANGNVR